MFNLLEIDFHPRSFYNTQASKQMKDFSCGTESHKLKIHLIFHQIQLTVKFQCKIVLALKNQQNKIVSQTVPKPLALGKCEISQQILIDWEAQYNSGLAEYLPSNLEIFVLVHATNGVIHAGLCTIDVTKSLHQAVIPLKKCSDKTATLTVTCTAQQSQTKLKNHNYVEHPYNGEPRSAYQSREKKINRLKSQQNKLSDSNYNQSVLSISKISMTSNKKIQNFLRGENQELARENDELRQKQKWLEHKQKQTFQQLKECMLKIQKLSNRCTQAEGLNELNEMLLFQKEKCVKSYENQINRLDDQKKDYFSQINALEQKLFSKEESFNKQNQKNSQKLLKLQQQLQKVTNSYLQALNRYEQSEKNASIISKEKQKNLQIQKSKNAKQNKNLQQMIAKLKQQNKSYQVRIAQLAQALEKAKNDESIKSQIREKDELIQKLSFDLQKIKKQKIEAQSELTQVQSAQEDRLSLKKRISQLQSQCNKYKSLLQKNNHSSISFQRKIEELSLNWEKLQSEKRQVFAQLDILNTQLGEKNKQLLNQQNQHNRLKDKYQQLSNLIKNSKIKEQTLQDQQRNEIKSLKQQLRGLQNQKQLFLAEKQVLTQNSEKKQTLNQQLNLNMQKLLQVRSLQDQQLKVVQNNLKQLKQVKQLNERSIQGLKTENMFYQQTLIDLQRQRYEQSSVYSNLIKQLSEIIQSEEPADYELLAAISDKQLKQSMEKSIKSRNSLLIKRKKDYESLLQQKIFIELQLQKLGQRFDQCEQYYEQQLLEEKEERETQLKEYMQQKNRLFEVIIEMQSQKLQLLSLKEQYYKQAKLLQHRVEQKDKDIERVKQVNRMLEQKLRQQQQNLISMTNYYQKKIGHIELQQKESQSLKQYDWQIQKEKNQALVVTLKDIIKNKEQELKSALKLNQQLEQKLFEIQSLNKKLEFDLSVKLYLYEETQAKFNQLSLQNGQLKNNLRELQTQIQRKSKQLTQKQIDINENSAKSIEQYDRFQQTIAELQKKRQELELSLQEKNEQINQWKYKLTLLEHEKDKQRKEVGQQTNKLIQDLSIYKILIDQAQNTIARLQQQNQYLKGQIIRSSEILQQHSG